MGGTADRGVKVCSILELMCWMIGWFGSCTWWMRWFLVSMRFDLVVRVCYSEHVHVGEVIVSTLNIGGENS